MNGPLLRVHRSRSPSLAARPSPSATPSTPSCSPPRAPTWRSSTPCATRNCPTARPGWSSAAASPRSTPRSCRPTPPSGPGRGAGQVGRAGPGRVRRAALSGPVARRPADVRGARHRRRDDRQPDARLPRRGRRQRLRASPARHPRARPRVPPHGHPRPRYRCHLNPTNPGAHPTPPPPSARRTRGDGRPGARSSRRASSRPGCTRPTCTRTGTACPAPPTASSPPPARTGRAGKRPDQRRSCSTALLTGQALGAAGREESGEGAVQGLAPVRDRRDACRCPGRVAENAVGGARGGALVGGAGGRCR